MTGKDKYARMANAIRFLSVDPVHRPDSARVGFPAAMADVITVLFAEFMKFDPKTPDWPDRDRFILSADHDSAMPYSLLYLLGYEDIDVNQMGKLRQSGKKTADYLKHDRFAGIETTNGLPGQGIANAVGMAIAERKLANEFGEDLVNHYTCCLVDDGCLMEGISQEAIALAGHLKLNKLIVLWYSNQITMDKPDSTDQIARFNACNWKTISINRHDPEEISAALQNVHSSDSPVMIACYPVTGSDLPGGEESANIHDISMINEPVTKVEEEPECKEKPFQIPAEALDDWRITGLRSGQQHREWEKRLCMMDAEVRGEFQRRMRGDLPSSITPAIMDFRHALAQDSSEKTTCESSVMVMGVINTILAETIGVSAGSISSGNVRAHQNSIIAPDNFAGRSIHWGIREHAMAAAMNGMALHGGLIPYSEGTLVFSDYFRAPIRLAAMMDIHCIHVLTQDSIGPYENGPAHQPVEHLATLRAIPNLLVMRPADAMETAECWQLALESQSAPSILVLSCQVLSLAREKYDAENSCFFGAYELGAASDTPQVSLFASGPEVRVALESRTELEREGIPTRVVSVPCFELFEAQNNKYQANIIGEAPVNIAIEAGVRQGWDRFIGNKGIFVGMNSFGCSAPVEELYKYFDITAEAVIKAVKTKLA